MSLELDPTAVTGPATWDPADEVEFPEGLPGFPTARRFVLLRQEAWEPLLFLKSVDQAGVCLPVAPAGVIRSGYQAVVDADQGQATGLPPGPVTAESGYLTLLTIRWSQPDPVVNFLGPIVVDIAARRAWQIVQPDGAMVRLADEAGDEHARD
jgi:flagellar assembly factor FliW